MQDSHPYFEDANQKFHFPPGVLEASRPRVQPGLEVPELRDEEGTPGLQPVPWELHKYSRGGLREAAAPYRTAGSAHHADELSFQGIQAVDGQQQPHRTPIPSIATISYPPSESQSLSESQSQAQTQSHPQPFSQPHSQWPAPSSTPNFHYAQSNSTNPLSLAPYGAYPQQHSTHDLQQTQPWHADPQYHYLASNIDSQLLNAPPDKAEHRAAATLAAMQKAKRKRVWQLVIGAVILIVVVVGAVVGGVVGSTNRSGDPPPSPPTATPTGGTGDEPELPPPTTIRMNSKLSASGYASQSGDVDYSVRLFFQDLDNQLRFISRDSTTSNWTDSTILDSLPYQPMVNGSITSSVFFVDPIKIILYYVDSDAIIRGHQFHLDMDGDGSIPKKGSESALNTYPVSAAEGSAISSYFPHIISQDPDNEMRWITMLGQNQNNLSAPWWKNDTSIGVELTAGSDMVVLPIAQAIENAYGVIYRSSDGKLSHKVHERDGVDLSGISWNRNGALGKSIPPSTSMAAFTVGRPYDGQNQVNTYILYQETDDTIQVVWQDDDNGWKGPQTFDAFKGARKGTDITCLMQAADVFRDLPREQDMNRCYFQVGDGKVREVWYDGNDWHDVGYIPIS